MRPVLALALLLAAGPAAATPVAPATDIWTEMLDPHGAEVERLIARAQDLLDGNEHARRPAAAYRVLQRAHALAPEDVQVLELLGTTADELGRVPEALEALAACARLAGDRVQPEVTAQLGAIYLRLGRLDDAVRWLERAQGPTYHNRHAEAHGAAAIDLAAALVARGDMASAIDRVSHALPGAQRDQPEQTALVAFALAVLYDRDEQPAAAFAVLDRLSSAHVLDVELRRRMARHRFVPAEDQLYFEALYHEALGARTEARADWALYAAIPDAAWRARALEHIRLIDTVARTEVRR